MNVTVVYSGGYAGIYVDGELKLTGDCLSETEIFETVGITPTVMDLDLEYDEDTDELFPDNLEDITNA
jgi:hypothetical protein